MPTILDKIVDTKKADIANRKKAISLENLKNKIDLSQPNRNFAEKLKNKINSKQPAIIAEIKKASPSKGVICENFHPDKIAKQYEANGACCLSVLTDQDYFQGHDDYLIQAHEASSLPILRKDFIVDPYQIYESKLLGADCILLICAILNLEELLEFERLAIKLNLDVLIESHNLEELQMALQCQSALIGINNRDLHKFETNLNTTLELKKYIPSHKIIITESGIHSKKEINLMNDNNIYGFLIGEGLMKMPEPGEALQKLIRK